MSEKQWSHESNNGLKYDLNRNVDSEVNRFLADGTLQSSEAKALKEIYDKNFWDRIIISKVNLKKIRDEIWSIETDGYLTVREQNRLGEIANWEWNNKLATKEEWTLPLDNQKWWTEKDHSKEKPNPNKWKSESSWNFWDFDWSGKKWGTPNKRISFPSLFNFGSKKESTPVQEEPTSLKTNQASIWSNPSQEWDWKKEKSQKLPKSREAILNNPAFSNRLDQVCSKIWANREDLIKVMIAESWLNPKAVNPISNATGLIQFMPDTARGLWTSISSLRGMSAIQQLDYVEKYFVQSSRWVPLNTIESLYQAVFYPVSLSKWKDFVYWSEKSIWYAKKVAKQNPGISKFSNKPGRLIDQIAFSKYVNDHVSKYTV